MAEARGRDCGRSDGYGELVGTSAAMRTLYDLLEKNSINVADRAAEG